MRLLRNNQSVQPASALSEVSRRLIRIIYFAFLASVGFYWVVLETMFAHIEEHNLEMIQTVLLIAAAAHAVVVAYLRLSRIASLLEDVRMEAAKLILLLRTYYVICFALSEAVALYGFVLRILGVSRADVAPFFVGAILLFLLCYPRWPERATGPVGQG
ncbi:MAG: hypothetical protein HY649_03565 [Acidobacteria bacterium]|nr:hypothetical protein [Acidobacteriota bacterium]